MTGVFTRRKPFMRRHRDSIKTLAGCGPSEERNEHLPVMEISCKEWRHATQPEKKKQRRKLLYFAIFTARNDASGLSVSHCLQYTETGNTDKRKTLVGLLADERGDVKIVDA